MSMAIGPYLTTEEVADILGVNQSRVHQFVGEGRISPVRRVGRMLLFDRKMVAKLAKQPRRTGRPKKDQKKSESPIAKSK